MLDKNYLNQILIDQRQSLLSSSLGIPRAVDLSEHIRSSDISVITGVRRCGKSTLLRQVTRSYPQHLILYLDLEDPRLLTFQVEDFQLLSELWDAEHHTVIQQRDSPPVLLMVDEVQNVLGWEKWIRYFAEKKQYKIYLTGSNSQMLSSELGSVLGGRYITIELFPFSVEELATQAVQDSPTLAHSTERLIILQGIVTRAMNSGLFPKPYIEESCKIYPTLFENIVTRDIAQRKGVRKTGQLYEFARLCAKDNSRLFNLKTTSALLGIKNQATIAKYVDYLEQSYLFFRLRPFSRSRRKSIRGGSKFYSIDPVLADAVAMQSKRSTVFLENLMFLKLRRSNSHFGYWHSSNGYEVDFVEQLTDDSLRAIQICFDLTSSVTLDREVRALLAARSELKAEKLIIVTHARVSEQVRKFVPEDIEIVTYLEFVGLW